MSFSQSDMLSFSKEKEITTVLNNEPILYSNKIQKMNSFIIKQERNIIITEESIYIFDKKKFKKKINYEDILALTFSSISNEFIIHRKSIYDYHLICSDKIKLMCAIIKAYEKKMKKAIILCEIKEKSLKPYFTSKKEKKKDINATKYDESKIIDTQTFLFDNESNVDNNFINKRSRSEVYNINSSHNNMNNNILFKTNTIPTDYINEEKNFDVIFCNDDSLKNLDENNLNYIKTLTRGKLCKIYLIQNNDNNKYYVIKSIDKKILDETDYEEKIEKNIKKLKHDFITNILFSYETNERIYFLYEYIQHENLFFHIKNKNYVFNEEKIKFYVASMIIILEYLHKNGINYRDFSTKNILINKEGYIKLNPFGIEKIFKIKKIYEDKIEKSEYTAPEILLNNNENNNNLKSADYWNLGIIIFELIYGIPPFYSSNANNIGEVISKSELKFPTKFEISENLKDLIVKLLNKNFEERLNDDNIKEHDFFKGFNFDDLINKKIESPYKPELSKNLKENKIYENNYTYEDLIQVESLDLK